MTVLTSQGISSLSIALLTRSIVLPMTVSRIPGTEFAGSNGDTITVRVRQPRSAKTQANPGDAISYEAINESSVNVTLSHLYDATRITNHDYSLNLEDFGSQVTEPQVQSVAIGAEDQIAIAMNGIGADGSFAETASESDTKSQILAARQALSAANVPAGERFMAVSPEIATRILGVSEFTRADASGSDTTLRSATIGRLYGFTFVESNALDAGTAVAYHRSGFAFATRTPVQPNGATESSTATANGIGMRHIFQYQPDILSDASVLSTFAGAGVVDSARVFKLNTTTGGTTTVSGKK